MSILRDIQECFKGNPTGKGSSAWQQLWKLLWSRLHRIIVIVLGMSVIIASIVIVPRIAGHGTPQGPQAALKLTPISSTPNACSKLEAFFPGDKGNGIGITHSRSSSDLIGISDGSFIFVDGSAANGERANLKCLGAQDLKQHPDRAELDWTRSLQLLPDQLADDSNDAEILIYREDSYVSRTCIAPNCVYITFVVATTLTGTHEEVSTGGDVLQGAYETQEEFNRDSANTPPKPSASQPSKRVRLLVANFGSNAQTSPSDKQQVIEQIAEAAKTSDLHIQGVLLGLSSLSLSTINGFTDLKRSAGRDIPIILASGFSETLIKQVAQPTVAKNIFYSIVPSIEREGKVGAKYVEQVLQKKRVAVFYNSDDNQYSNILAQAFKGQFNGIVWDETYTIGTSTSKSLESDLNDAVSQNADLIYFAGDATTADALLQLEIQKNLPVQIMGGDELYHLGGYNNGRYKNLLFTSFAFPDEWGNLGQSGQQPPTFLNQYRLLFDGWPLDRSYGHSRPDSNVILAHDGLSVLLEACQTKTASCWANADNPRSDQLLKALVQMKDFVGFSGYISFGSDNNLPGNPLNKLVLVLGVDDTSHTHIEPEQKRPAFDGCVFKDYCPTI